MQNHIPQMLKERCSQYGDRQVFQFKNKSNQKYEAISWNKLYSDTEKVSRSLISLGYSYNDKIGILSFNRPEWTISDLGILAVRAIVVPLYATASKQDIKYIIDETEMKLLFVGNNDQVEKALWLLENCDTLEKIITYQEEIPANDNRFLDWKSFLNLTQNGEHTDQLNEIYESIQSEDIATIIYTSGTTGEPKGAMLTHSNFMNALKINNERLNVHDEDTSFCFLPLSHVFERTWVYFLLYCGATNIYLENPRKVIEELPKVKPTVMCTVSRFFEKTYDGIQKEKNKWPGFKQNIFDWSISIGHQYIEYLKDSEKAPALLKIKRSIADKLVLNKLRQVFGGNIKTLPCAGAAIDSKLLRFFHATGVFINYGYGATETTATVSCFRTNKYNFDYCGSIMPEVSINISDQNEILIKGKTVFKGYYNKPEETAKVLKDGWYYSGDEGYVVDNEYLVMTDRIKDLIKTSGGKYISPQKLELLIGQDQYVDQIVIIGDKRKYVTALIVPSSEDLKKLALFLDLDDKNKELLVENPKIKEFFQNRIEKLQNELSPYEKIIKFKLLANAFNIDNNTLTNTLKIRRKEIIKIYTKDIEKMYSSF
ncbi:MAG: long-chain fatty acid--CoA ligase [Bacteroidales bacterium]|nr:long-chain fatty acid--CoA ligase [Bacteroidales bacterium]